MVKIGPKLGSFGNESGKTFVEVLLCVDEGLSLGLEAQRFFHPFPRLQGEWKGNGSQGR
jgi:hypothetical protein